MKTGAIRRHQIDVALKQQCVSALAFGTSDQEGALTTLGLAYEQQHRLGAAVHVFHTLARYSPKLAQTLLANASTQ